MAIFILDENRVVATALLTAAGISDFLDGWYARQYKQESSFGKLMDPVADKVLLCVAVVFLVARPMERMDPWLGMLLLAREFLISGLRSFAAAAGFVLGAGSIGKTKTALQMVGLGVLIVGDAYPPLPGYRIGIGLLWASVFLSYWSMVRYLRIVYLELRTKTPVQ